MESPRVWVIDGSPTIRETITVILGDDCGVLGVAPEEFIQDSSRVADVDLLILADDALSADAVAALPRGPAILWLQSDRLPPPVTPHASVAIPRSFNPQALRNHVRELLAKSPPRTIAAGTWPVIDYPVLPHDALLLARRAAQTNLPVLICGEAGTGKARLARAICAGRRGSRFVSLSSTGSQFAALVQICQLAPGPITLFVHDVARLPPEGQQLLRELLDCGGIESAAGWHAVRLIAATGQSFDALAQCAPLDRELVYRLSVLPISLPPLRDRAHDMPALVTRLAADLARSLSAPQVSFTPKAMERLTRYLWFGNLAELETVLTRTLALNHATIIDADDLLFGYGRVVPRVTAVMPRGAPQPTPHEGTEETVDLVINELAHEFKNPMVTIKTVAQHLERLLADETGREQVARLTGEAVDRMDRALENLLQFTRFEAPTPAALSLNALLAPCLTDLTPTLTECRLLLNYQPPPVSDVYVDGPQVTYALENLLRVIVRDLSEGDTLAIRTMAAPAAVVFEFPSSHRSTAGKLAAFLDTTHDGASGAAPLGLVFARTLVERNRGHVEICNGAGQSAITVWLPSPDEIARTHGKTAHLNS